MRLNFPEIRRNSNDDNSNEKYKPVRFNFLKLIKDYQILETSDDFMVEKKEFEMNRKQRLERMLAEIKKYYWDHEEELKNLGELNYLNKTQESPVKNLGEFIVLHNIQVPESQ